jgi:hypothetical protein
MTAFTFDEAAHEYGIDGVRLPSVTEIIKPLAPDFSMVPAGVLEAKRALGKAVHLACELDDNGELDEATTDPDVMGYVMAWRSFREHAETAVIANERRMMSHHYRFAGTLDRVVTARLKNGVGDWLIDIKTGAEPHSYFGVQLFGYSILMAENDVCDCSLLGRATLHLSADATYRLNTYRNPNDAAAFHACLALYRWKESHK